MTPKTSIASYTIDALWTMDLPEPRWVIPNLIPEGLVFLAGRPKAGKSWLALRVCLAVAGIEHSLGTLRVEHGEALYCALEDSPRRIKQRIKKLGISHLNQSITVVHQLPPLDHGGLEYIEEWLKGHPDARIVVIDTLQKVAPKRRMNGDRYGEDYEFAGSLQALAMRYRVTILAVHHTRKQRAETPLDEVSGTTGLTGAADAVIVLKKAQAVTDLHVTGRDIEERMLRGEGSLASRGWTLSDASQDGPLSQSRQAIIELLRQRGALTSKEVAQLLGIVEKTAASTLSRMDAAGQVVHRDGKYFVPANAANNQNSATTATAEN